MMMDGINCGRCELVEWTEGAPLSAEEAYDKVAQKLGDQDEMTFDAGTLTVEKSFNPFNRDETITVTKKSGQYEWKVYRFVRDASWFSDEVEYRAEKGMIGIFWDTWASMRLGSQIYFFNASDRNYYHTLFGSTNHFRCEC